MPKKKKTRKQKTLADERRKIEPKVTQTAVIESKPQAREEHVSAPISAPPQPIHNSTVPRNIITTNYHYLAGDLRKTLLLTGVIVGIQLLIKFGTDI